MIGIQNVDSSEDSNEDEQHNSQEEIFFVTIQIDETFLKYLDDPEYIEPLDVIYKVESLIENKTFIQNVIKKELK